MTEHLPYQNITLETVDQAINDWFDLTVDAHVERPGSPRMKVPVNMAAGERWIGSRSKKGIRDKNGVLILPIISLRRTGIEPNQTMAALGTETPTITISKQIAQKTNALRNLSVLRTPGTRDDNAVVYEVTTIPFPDRSILTYNVDIQCQYIGQMNKILEKIFHMLDLQKSFMAPIYNNNHHPQIAVPFEKRIPFAGPFVVGFFESSMNDQGNFEEFTDQERIVKYSTTFTVPTVLQLDPEGEKPSVRIERTAFKTKFKIEECHELDSSEEIDILFSSLR